MDLKKIAQRLDPLHKAGVTGVHGVTDSETLVLSRACDVIPGVHLEQSRYYTPTEGGCNTVLHLDSVAGITHQPVDSVGVTGGVIPRTPVTPPYVEGPGVLTKFLRDAQTPPRWITEARDLDDVLPALCAAPLVAVDTETTGLNPLTDRLRLVQFAVPGGPTVAVDSWQVPVQLLEPIFTARHVLAFHNAKFDLKMLAAAGVSWLTARLVDTQVAAQLLGAGTEAGRLSSCGLAALAQRWLGIEVDKSLQHSDWSGSLAPEQVAYAVKDAMVTAQLALVLKDALAQADLQRALVVECGCLPALAAMELAGLPVDATCWQQRAEADQAEAAQLAASLAALLDESRTGTGWLFAEAVNWESQPQVLELLRNRGHMAANTDDDTLATLEDADPLVPMLRTYRAAQKRVSTYGSFWLTDYVHPRTQRLHADYLQLGSRAGRMSCTKPNVQNIPRSAAYRRAIAAPAGHCLLKADYSQIELRIAAVMAPDNAMLAAYQAGQDLHVLTAAHLLGVEASQVTAAQRQMAKAVNFGLIYGMGVAGLQAYAWNTYGVRLTLHEAQQAHQQFFRLYPGVRRWHAHTQAAAPTETRTLVGRRRRGLDKLTDRLNTPVQGSGADGLKWAMAALFRHRAEAPDAQLVAAIHDELLVECPIESAAHTAAWLEKYMVAGMAAIVGEAMPIVVETTIGQDWAGTPLDMHD
jgi:DNA polymerase I